MENLNFASPNYKALGHKYNSFSNTGPVKTHIERTKCDVPEPTSYSNGGSVSTTKSINEIQPSSSWSSDYAVLMTNTTL